LLKTPSTDPDERVFPHPALARGNNAHAAQGRGMTDRRQRQPASEETPRAIREHAAGIVRGLLRYSRSVRLPGSVRHRRASLDFPMRPRAATVPLEPGTSRFPREVLPSVHGVSDRAGLRHTSRYRSAGWGLPHLLTASASRSNCLTRLNTRPARPMSTLRRRPCERLRMTRGRCGSRFHLRMTFSFTAPCRFSRRTGETK
jgi:hypothetical protein